MADFFIKYRNIAWSDKDDRGTRVIDIAIEYEVLGRSSDEIIRSHPHLSLYQIHDALSYYYENRDELDQKMKQDQEFIRQLKEKFPSKMG